jgi:hypothetical protein
MVIYDDGCLRDLLSGYLRSFPAYLIRKSMGRVGPNISDEKPLVKNQ